MSAKEYSRAELRTLSILGMRGTFGTTLNDLAGNDERIFGLTADLTTTSGMDRFSKAFPERFLNVGIAEQNMIGIAAGLAREGYVPFASTFSNFAALRACEQIRHFLGYMGENVKVVGLAGGFAMGMFGITHYGVEDIAALRAIDGLCIISPADGLETVSAVTAAAAFPGPVYIRLTGGMNLPIIYKSDIDFQIGKSIELRHGDDLAIIATGAVTGAALSAVSILEKEGIRATLIDMHTIKPLDEKKLMALANMPLVVTVEEHSVAGGLGGAVAEYYAGVSGSPKIKIIGSKNAYKVAGDYTWLLEHHGLSAEKIADVIRREI